MPITDKKEVMVISHCTYGNVSMLKSHLDKAHVTALSSKLVFLSVACLAVSYVVRSEQREIILVPRYAMVSVLFLFV